MAARQRASRRRGGHRWHRSVLRTVRRQRRNHHQVARGHGLGHEGLLYRGPRRPHHLLWRPPDGRLTTIVFIMSLPAAFYREHWIIRNGAWIGFPRRSDRG